MLEQCRAEVEAALGRPITDQMAEALEGALLERLTTALRADPEGFRALPPAIRLTRAAEDLASQGVARARARLRQAQEAARGGRVNQDGPDGSRPRGQTELGDNPVIRLGEAADESTFLHEGAHYYLDLLERLAARGDAPQAVTARYEAARRWLGAAPGEALTREQHERFADSFLAYVREGKAPTPGLRAAFDKFREWLTSLYRSLADLGVELTPQVRGFFDEMLGRRVDRGSSAGRAARFTSDQAQAWLDANAEITTSGSVRWEDGAFAVVRVSPRDGEPAGDALKLELLARQDNPLGGQVREVNLVFNNRVNPDASSPQGREAASAALQVFGRGAIAFRGVAERAPEVYGFAPARPELTGLYRRFLRQATPDGWVALEFTSRLRQGLGETTRTEFLVGPEALVAEVSQSGRRRVDGGGEVTWSATVLKEARSANAATARDPGRPPGRLRDGGPVRVGAGAADGPALDAGGGAAGSAVAAGNGPDNGGASGLTFSEGARRFGTDAELAELVALVERRATLEELAAHPAWQRVTKAVAEETPTRTPDQAAAGQLRDGPAYRDGMTADDALAALYDEYDTASGAPAAAERRAVVVIGPPGAGKSTFIPPLVQAFRAAVVDADMAKALMVEYEGGAGSQRVHAESVIFRRAALQRLLQDGKNLVVERVGDNTAGVLGQIRDLQAEGYDVSLVWVDVQKDEAFRRATRRWLASGRHVKPSQYDDLDAKITAAVQEALDADGPSAYLRIDANGQPGTAFAAASQGAGGELLAAVAPRLGADRGSGATPGQPPGDDPGGPPPSAGPNAPGPNAAPSPGRLTPAAQGFDARVFTLSPELAQLADAVDAARADVVDAQAQGRLTPDEAQAALTPAEDPARAKLRFEALRAGAFCLRYNGAF